MVTIITMLYHRHTVVTRRGLCKYKCAEIVSKFSPLGQNKHNSFHFIPDSQNLNCIYIIHFPVVFVMLHVADVAVVS